MPCSLRNGPSKPLCLCGPRELKCKPELRERSAQVGGGGAHVFINVKVKDQPRLLLRNDPPWFCLFVWCFCLEAASLLGLELTNPALPLACVLQGPTFLRLHTRAASTQQHSTFLMGVLRLRFRSSSFSSKPIVSRPSSPTPQL